MKHRHLPSGPLRSPLITPALVQRLGICLQDWLARHTAWAVPWRRGVVAGLILGALAFGNVASAGTPAPVAAPASGVEKFTLANGITLL